MTVPPTKKDAVKEPETAWVLVVLGWIVIIASIIPLIGAFAGEGAHLFGVFGGGFVTGAVLIGFGHGLTLLTKIANYLARLVSKAEPAAPEPMKEILKEAAQRNQEPEEPYRL